MAPTSYWQTSNYTRIKNNKRLLLNLSVIKLWQFVSLTVTVFRLEKIPGDNYTHLNITTIVSWLSLAKHYINANKIWVVQHRSLALPLLSSSAYFKFQSHVLCMWLKRQQFWGPRTFHKIHWGSFFLLWDKTETKMYDL